MTAPPDDPTTVATETNAAAPRFQDPVTALAKRPYEYDFFQVLRRIESLNRTKPRIGEALRASDDPIRLAQNPSMNFAPSTLAAFEPGANGRPWRLLQNFLGLLGPNGPLPLHLTEYAGERVRNSRDRTFVRFLDAFHHRMVALFYRAWASAQPTVSHDRPESDRFAFYVGSLFGIGPEAFRDRDDMPDLAKLFFAGRLAAQVRNAEGLEAILQAFFRVPVTIRQFVGEWMTLPRDSLCLLGASAELGVLGRSATIGERVWGAHQKFRIVFGPIGRDDYERLLPGGESLPRLVSIVRNYVGDVLTWDVNLVLRKEDVPPCQLGSSARLGWNTWVANEPIAEDRGDLRLKPMIYARRKSPGTAGVPGEAVAVH